MDAKKDRWKEALCPGCGKPADHFNMFGLRFKCKTCDRSWGHLRHMNTHEASEALYDAREKFDVHEKAASGEPWPVPQPREPK